MDTLPYHKRIDIYISSLPTASDKMTQFYEACQIAKLALQEVDTLKKFIAENGQRSPLI